MDKLVFDVVALSVLLLVAVGGLLILGIFVRRLQSGIGGKGKGLASVIQETRELGRERLQVERELLAAQKETNELLKQMIAKQKP